MENPAVCPSVIYIFSRATVGVIIIIIIRHMISATEGKNCLQVLRLLRSLSGKAIDFDTKGMTPRPYRLSPRAAFWLRSVNLARYGRNLRQIPTDTDVCYFAASLLVRRACFCSVYLVWFFSSYRGAATKYIWRLHVMRYQINRVCFFVLCLSFPL